MRWNPWSSRSSRLAGRGADNGRGPESEASAEQGIALIVVLWGLTLLSIVATSFMTEARTTTKLTWNMMTNAQAEALSDAGVNRAMVGLHDPLEEGGWRVDGRVYAWRFGEGELRIAIEAEGGKIDLNHAPDELLHALFLFLGLGEYEASVLVDTIADFRDRDDVRRPNGAETAEYQAAGQAYGPKNAPFDSIDELRLVLGMWQDLYERAAPALTVYARRRFPEPLFAPPEVEEALILSEAMPAGIGDVGESEGRRQEDRQGRAPTNAGSATQDPGQDQPSVRSRVPNYTIHAEARMDNGAIFVRDAVIHLTGNPTNPFEIYAWRQGRPDLFAAEDSTRSE